MSAQRRILVLDDEPQILRALRVVLREAGLRGAAGDARWRRRSTWPRSNAPDAAILDLVLPDGDGIELTRKLREWTQMPIIVLSAVGEESEKVRALAAGADDYVTKPFGPPELVARLEAALRRSAPEPGKPILQRRAASSSIAPPGRCASMAEEVHLTPIEFGLLTELLSHPGRPLTHAALLTKVWGPAYADDVATLRTHMANLRRKVDAAPEHLIRTESGIGYRLTPPLRISVP